MAGRYWPVAETVSLSPCRNYKIWLTGMSTQDAVPLQQMTCAIRIKVMLFIWIWLVKVLLNLNIFMREISVYIYIYGRKKSSSLCLFMSSTCVFCVQDSVEALLFLRWWGVHCGRFSQAARPLHLGEEHWQPGEDPAWNQRRAVAGCRCKDVKTEILTW